MSELVEDVKPEQKNNITDDQYSSLVVDVSKDPPLEPRIRDLLARAPYAPEDRNDHLRRTHTTPPRVRQRVLHDIDTYGGASMPKTLLFAGGSECLASLDYEEVFDVSR